MAANAIALMEEAKWEMESTRRAAERYREAAEAADPSTLPSGQWLLRQIIPRLIEEITQLQLKGADAIARGGNPPKWSWPVQLLPAKELALITCVVGLDAVRGQADGGGTISGTARAIAGAVRDELEYRRWVTEQAEANKAARAAQDWTHEDILTRFQRRYPNANRKVWGKWRKKIAATREEKWEQATETDFGTALISALVAAAPDHFEVAKRAAAGSTATTAYLKISEATMERLQDIETRAEVARPLLMPMLIPPLQWRYE